MILVLVAAAALFTALQDSASATERKVKFKVEGATCMSGAAEAEAIPKRLAGVQSAEYDYAESAVTVVFDDATVSIEDLVKTFKKENFPVVEEPVVLK
jgi:copper chaperone CopZ